MLFPGRYAHVVPAEPIRVRAAHEDPSDKYRGVRRRVQDIPVDMKPRQGYTRLIEQRAYEVRWPVGKVFPSAGVSLVCQVDRILTEMVCEEIFIFCRFLGRIGPGPGAGDSRLGKGCGCD